MQELHNIPEIEDIEVTAKTLEKFVNFKVKVYESKFRLDFKDSLNFLVGSLTGLIKNLKCKAETIVSNQEDALSKYFPNTKRLFRNFQNCSDDFNLLLRKGVFPYSYITSLERLNEQ